MSESELWVMPNWMEPYRAFICNTGGNPVEEMVNGNANTFSNLPLSTLQACVKSQVVLLSSLHAAGLIGQCNPDSCQSPRKQLIYKFVEDITKLREGERETLFSLLGGVVCLRCGSSRPGSECRCWDDT